MASLEDLLDQLQPVFDDGPPPMAWPEYSEKATRAFQTRLEAATHEREMQEIFEEHPPLLPGGFPGFVGHGAYLEAVISQPDLQGLGDRQPDFMYITRNSAFLQPVLIEIEKPTKRWLAGKEHQPSADLTQAMNQFRQWREWFNRAENHLVFMSQYGIPREWGARRFSPIYMLIYGRRSENPEQIARLRAEHQREDQVLITYDHIEPSDRQKNYISVKRKGEGVFEALHMPACASLTPSHSGAWALIRGRAQMVERNPWLTTERKRYLIEDRLPRWDDWADRYDERQKAYFATAKRPRSQGTS